jgi:hypothetical protein
MNQSVFNLTRLFGGRGSAIAQAFLGSTAVKAAIAEVESVSKQRRADLVERLRTADARHEQGILKAAKAVDDAQRELDAAKAALERANTKCSDLKDRANSLSLVLANEKGRLARELNDSADPRFDQFANACTALFNEVRHTPSLIVLDEITDKHISYENSHILRALNALQASAAAARDLKLQALSSDEVTTELTRLAKALAVPLADVRREMPEMDAEPAVLSINLH